MYYKCQLVFELNRMIQLYNYNYKFKILKKSIEKLETDKNSNILFELLRTLNDVTKFFFPNMHNDLNSSKKEDFIRDKFNIYLDILKRYGFAIGNISDIFTKEYRTDFKAQLLNHWSKSISGYSPNEKSFIEIFDDIHNTSILKYPHIFTVKLKSLKYLYRVQRGNHYGDYDRLIPKAQFVKNKNRWNPEGTAFQYLGYANNIAPYNDVINMIEMTCSREIRLKAGECFTSCRFRSLNKNNKILNLCWSDLDLDRLGIEFNNKISELSQNEVNKILSSSTYKRQLQSLIGTEDLKPKIRDIAYKESNKKKKVIKDFTEIHLSKIMMKTIDEAVFLPVEQEDDPDLKAYIPFHYLSEYLQNKGYAGILYRSTQMDKVGLNGTNLVLFNTSDAVPIEGTMNVYYYDGDSYSKINV